MQCRRNAAGTGTRSQAAVVWSPSRPSLLACVPFRIIRTPPSRHCSSSSSCWPRRPSRSCVSPSRLAVVAMVAFNFFLLPPFHTLTIADPQNWVALFVFVVVAIIASQLSAAVRQRAQRGGDAQAGGDAALRSQPRHPADHRERARDCRCRPIRRPSFRARSHRHLPANGGRMGRASGRRAFR